MPNATTTTTAVYLGLGTNLGNRRGNIQEAYDLIEKRVGVIEQKSAYYETPPWGFDSEHHFLNTVVLIKTSLSPQVLLIELKAIERFLGRTFSTGKGYSDRIIDIDIIDYGGDVLETEYLQIPHPKMTQRNFVLIPLAEIAPNWNHSKLKLSINHLVKQLAKHPKIKQLNE